METRSAPRSAKSSGVVCMLVIALALIGAVLGATAGPVVRTASAAEESLQPCPDDGSIGCALLWFEYYLCKTAGGMCPVPCCDRSDSKGALLEAEASIE